MRRVSFFEKCKPNSTYYEAKEYLNSNKGFARLLKMHINIEVRRGLIPSFSLCHGFAVEERLAKHIWLQEDLPPLYNGYPRELGEQEGDLVYLDKLWRESGIDGRRLLHELHPDLMEEAQRKGDLGGDNVLVNLLRRKSPYFNRIYGKQDSFFVVRKRPRMSRAKIYLTMAGYLYFQKEFVVSYSHCLFENYSHYKNLTKKEISLMASVHGSQYFVGQCGISKRYFEGERGDI